MENLQVFLEYYSGLIKPQTQGYIQDKVSDIVGLFDPISRRPGVTSSVAKWNPGGGKCKPQNPRKDYRSQWSIFVKDDKLKKTA